MYALGYLMGLVIAIVFWGAIIVGVVILIVKAVKSNDIKRTDMNFINYCVSILAQNGFQNIQITKDSPYYDIDILACKNGQTYAIRCMNASQTISENLIRKTLSGQNSYKCVYGVVMTNQYITEAIASVAGRLNILIWDRGALDRMSATGTSSEV